MEALLISFLAIAAAEIGDKTQLIALCLASRFHKPVPIILGILCATLANHAVTGLIGQWLGSLLSGNVLHILLALSFFAAAWWAFIPDKLDEDCTKAFSSHSIFITTAITFFVAEIGDKTQLATATLAAQFQPLVAVIVGTTLGMMAANIPAVLCSRMIMKKIPLNIVRMVSGLFFAGLGLFEISKMLTH
ncbi:MAG TPA: TMEM165/GDT1 family protein [Rickettsiales bacterium]|nr:TMEM165/GDT1 family protein [Rickettsiales bacterium]